jgi:hypothetical protein
MPWGATTVFVPPIVGSVINRVGERPLIVAGLGLNAAAMAWIAIGACAGLSFIGAVAGLALTRRREDKGMERAGARRVTFGWNRMKYGPTALPDRRDCATIDSWPAWADRHGAGLCISSREPLPDVSLPSSPHGHWRRRGRQAQPLR